MSLIDLALNNQQMFLVDSWNPHLAVPLLFQLGFLGKSQDNSSSLLLVDHKGTHTFFPLSNSGECTFISVTFSFALPPKSLTSGLTCLHGFLVVHCHLATSRNIYEDLESLKILLFFSLRQNPVIPTLELVGGNGWDHSMATAFTKEVSQIHFSKSTQLFNTLRRF